LGKRAKTIKRLQDVPLSRWFPRRRQPGVEYFHTTLHEDFSNALVESRANFIAQRIISLKHFIDVVGDDFKQYLDAQPGLVDLISRKGPFVPDWILEFYATVWIAPGHTAIHFSFQGEQRDISSTVAREVLGLLQQPVRIHEIAYPSV
jgi:hypothetical protein